MIPRRWLVAGWLFFVATAGLAVSGAILALAAVCGQHVQPYTALGSILPARLDSSEFIIGIILAVLAGVAFFSGLACFFWGAMLASRQRMEQILQSLHRSEWSRPSGVRESSPCAGVQQIGSAAQPRRRSAAAASSLGMR